MVENDRSLLVWQGIPGEKAYVKLEHRGQNQSYAKWTNSPEPHPQRVTPKCDRYTLCGGCPMMHLNQQGQVDARVGLVRQALDEVGLNSVGIGEFHPSPDGMADFRHVVKVAVGESDEGRLRLGAWGRLNKHVVPIPDCVVAAPVLRRVMDALAFHVIDLNLRMYDPATGRGVLRVAILRASRSTGEVLVTLVAGRQVRELADLADRIAAQVTEIVGVWLHINDGPGNAIFQRDGTGVVGTKPLNGKGQIEERLNGVTYSIGPGDFFQTNPAMAEVLYARTVERLALKEGTPVVDLYCGVGGIALQAAKVTGWAMGVEEVDGAVLRARDAATRNKISAEFIAGKVEYVLEDVQKRLVASRPVLTVNPARRGLEPGVVEGIVALSPRKIAYISCNPRAMARDLTLFRDAGYKIGEVELFDMFPNTAHVETLVTLEGPDADDAESLRSPRRKVVRKV